MRELRYSEDLEKLRGMFCDDLVATAREILSSKGRTPVVFLSGGSTPLPFYSALASRLASGPNPPPFRFFMGDERNVMPDDPSSNYGNAVSSLCGGPAVAEGSVEGLRMGLSSPREIADEYDSRIAMAIADNDMRPDVMILGIGADAHTASLFPGTIPDGARYSRADGREAAFFSHYVPALGVVRYSVTPGLVRRTVKIIILALGAGKAEALKKASADPCDADAVPASIIFEDRDRPGRDAVIYSDFMI